MKRQTFNVLFFIRKTRTVKSGETPIMLRITIQGQLAEIQLKRTIKSELWSQAKERCTGKDAKSVEVNRYLESCHAGGGSPHRALNKSFVTLAALMRIASQLQRRCFAMLSAYVGILSRTTCQVIESCM